MSFHLSNRNLKAYFKSTALFCNKKSNTPQKLLETLGVKPIVNGRAIQPVMADIMAVHLTSCRPRYIPSSACKTAGLPENEERKIPASF